MFSYALSFQFSTSCPALASLLSRYVVGTWNFLCQFRGKFFKSSLQVSGQRYPMTNSARLSCSSDEPLRAIHSHGTQLRAGRELDALATLMFGVKEICKITSSSDIPDIPNNPTTTDPPLRTLYYIPCLAWSPNNMPQWLRRSQATPRVLRMPLGLQPGLTRVVGDMATGWQGDRVTCLQVRHRFIFDGAADITDI